MYIKLKRIARQQHEFAFSVKHYSAAVHNSVILSSAGFNRKLLALPFWYKDIALMHLHVHNNKLMHKMGYCLCYAHMQCIESVHVKTHFVSSSL